MKFVQWLSRIITVTVLFYGFAENVNANTIPPPIVLKGDGGGMVNGQEWKSDLLKDKVNLLIYTTPGKQKGVKPLLDKLDNIEYSEMQFGITFVVNLDVIAIVERFVRKKLEKRADADKIKSYVIDKEKKFVKAWNLKDDDSNILLFDSSGNIVYAHTGKITENIANDILFKIDELILEININTKVY